MASREPNDRPNEYAPLIAIALGAGATLLKKASVRYVTKREARLEWSDVGVALVTAAITYYSFRSNYGSEKEAWYKR